MMHPFSSVSSAGILAIFFLALIFQVKGYTSSEYEEDNEPMEKHPREFMIPYPRLGRYMDYAVLKVLAEYMKDNYNYNDILQQYPRIGGDNPTEGDIVLQRELRDMKGKGYGIPIPRVGKRSPPAGSAEQMPLAGAGVGLGNGSLRKLLAEIYRENAGAAESKRETSTRLMQFKPRVGRSKYGAWVPIPRVGRRR